MVILGWTDLFHNTSDERYLSAAIRAADWLCEIIGNDGKLSNFAYMNIPHAYHSRVMGFARGFSLYKLNYI
jgi:hypothetical protein